LQIHNLRQPPAHKLERDLVNLSYVTSHGLSKTSLIRLNSHTCLGKLSWNLRPARAAVQL